VIDHRGSDSINAGQQHAMTPSHHPRLDRGRPPRYLWWAECLCYFVICAAPCTGLWFHPASANASRLPSVLVVLATLILGVVALVAVLEKKHRSK